MDYLALKYLSAEMISNVLGCVLNGKRNWLVATTLKAWLR